MGRAMTQIDLALGLLDHQLVDADGEECGKVDDLELDLDAPGGPQVTEILVGPTAWRNRGRLGRLAAALAGGRIVHVPWSEVAKLGSDVDLARPAAELRLGRGDERARPWVERIPGSRL
jgi:sporulation protein YlmC with PRC-barrel domain